MLTWCTKKMSSHHNRHYRLLDTHAEPAPRAAVSPCLLASFSRVTHPSGTQYVPSVAAVEAARRRMEEQSRRPALPRSAFRVGSREQMPPPPPPKDEPPAWPTRKSSRDALNPPEVDYKVRCFRIMRLPRAKTLPYSALQPPRLGDAISSNSFRRRRRRSLRRAWCVCSPPTSTEC